MSFALRAKRVQQLAQQLARNLGPSQGVEGLEAQAQCRNVALQLSLARGFRTARPAFADAATQPTAASQGPPYAIVGGALAVTGGLLYMLFGGSSPAAPPIEVAAADSHESSSGISYRNIGSVDIVTHHGNKFAAEELHGDFSMLYFGDTSGSETVTELERMAEIVGLSDKLSNMHYLAPVFVSLNSGSDAAKRMEHVVEMFDTNHNRTGLRLLGLAGKDTQKLHQAALKFGDREQKPVDKPDTTFFFCSPEGDFVKAYSGLSSPKDIAEDMTSTMIKYKTNNPTWHGPKKVAKRHA